MDKQKYINIFKFTKKSCIIFKFEDIFKVLKKILLFNFIYMLNVIYLIIWENCALGFSSQHNSIFETQQWEI